MDGKGTFAGVGREEAHAYGVGAGGGKFESGGAAQECVRQVQQDAGAVAGAFIGTDCATVLQSAQRGQYVGDDLVAGLVLQGRDHRQTAGILFSSRVVQACAAGIAEKRV